MFLGDVATLFGDVAMYDVTSDVTSLTAQSPSRYLVVLVVKLLACFMCLENVKLSIKSAILIPETTLYSICVNICHQRT